GDEPCGALQRLALRAEGGRAVVLAEDGELVAPRAIGAPAPPREPGFIAREVLVVGGARKAQPERGPQLARGKLEAVLSIFHGRIALERRPELALGAIGPALPQHDVADADARARFVIGAEKRAIVLERRVVAAGPGEAVRHCIAQRSRACRVAVKRRASEACRLVVVARLVRL